MIVINLSSYGTCQLCGQPAFLDFAVPFYERPRPDMQIGQRMLDGEVVGGMACCQDCHTYIMGIERDV